MNHARARCAAILVGSIVSTPLWAWTSPAVIEADTQGRTSFPLIGVDGAGNAISVWIEFDIENSGARFNLWANRYTAGSGWGTAETLESAAGDVIHTTLAVDSAGNAVVAWTQSDTSIYRDAWVRTYSPATNWSAARKLIDSNTDGQASTMHAGFDASGNAILVWTQESLPFGSAGYTQDIVAARYVPGNGWSVAGKINGTKSPSTDPDLGFDGAGVATVVWKAEKSGTPGAIWYNRFTPTASTNTGTWGTAQALSAGTSGQAPRIAVNANGDAVVAWYTAVAPSILARRYVAGTGWDPEQTVYSVSLEVPAWPRIAMDASGNAIVVFQNGVLSRPGFDVRASRSAPSQPWTASELLEQTTPDAQTPAIAMDTGGNAVAVWAQPSADNGVAKLWSNRYLTGSGWQGAELVDSGFNEAVVAPEIHSNATGTTFAVWAQGTSPIRGDTWSASTSTTDASAPTPPAPGTGTGGSTDGATANGSGSTSGGGGGGALDVPALILLAGAALRYRRRRRLVKNFAAIAR